MKKIAFMILPRQDKFEDAFLQSVRIVCDEVLLHFDGFARSTLLHLAYKTCLLARKRSAVSDFRLSARSIQN